MEGEGGAGPVLEKITFALETWLDNITILEERQQLVRGLEDRVNRTLQQIQLEGLISIYDLGTLRYIGQIWIQLVNLLPLSGGDEDRKRQVITNILKLYDARQISLELCTEVIVNL